MKRLSPKQRAAALRLARRLGKAAVDEHERQSDDPETYAKMHERLADSLPRWRWAARLFHRTMARRLRAQ